MSADDPMCAPAPQPVFRFAPSPNGFLHLGHARSAILNHALAQRLGGRFLLRIEDIDRERSREPFVVAIEEDLRWLGLAWEQPVLRQSSRFAQYRAVATDLLDRDEAYPCFCSRTEIGQAVAAREREDGRPALRDPDGAPLYPGTCRALGAAAAATRMAQEPFVLRLRAERVVPTALYWRDWSPLTDAIIERPAGLADWGDIVLFRRDDAPSYHLAVVIDDAFQGVSHVVRGKDLEAATGVHRVLQAMLGLPSPLYHHHELVLGADGRKLSKSTGSTALRDLRRGGTSAEEARRLAMRALRQQVRSA
jgi:glutamyl-Q tRNA(Asp) synthetase